MTKMTTTMSIERHLKPKQMLSGLVFGVQFFLFFFFHYCMHIWVCETVSGREIKKERGRETRIKAKKEIFGTMTSGGRKGCAKFFYRHFQQCYCPFFIIVQALTTVFKSALYTNTIYIVCRHTTHKKYFFTIFFLLKFQWSYDYQWNEKRTHSFSFISVLPLNSAVW